MGFTFDGKIKAYDINLYSNAGNTLDVSKKVELFFGLYNVKIGGHTVYLTNFLSF